MNKAKYKIAITEIAAKTAAKKNGGAAARFWGVIIINKENASKLVDAWSMNFSSKLEVVKA